MPQNKMFAAITVVAMMAGSALAQHNPASRLPLHERSASLQQKRAETGIGNNPFLPVDYPGGIANQNPFAINDNGRIVGVAILPNGTIKGYLLSGRSFKDIVYPGAKASAAYGINKSGLIVGIHCDDVNCNVFHGFSLQGQTFTSLDFPGGVNTNPSSVNNAGDIVGYYQTSDFALHGFMLHQGVYTSIDVPGANETIAFGINNQGVIAGGYGTPDGSGHGFILQGGVFTQVDYPGALGTELTSINDSGDAVGNYNNSGDLSNYGLFMSGGVLTRFQVPFPGSISTLPWGMNNRHQIVGSYGSYPPDYFFGFLTTY